MDVLVEEALRRAFVAGGCPICRLGETAARRDLRFVLDEHVNSVAVRRKLLAAWGWCRRHAWYFLRLEGLVEGDGLGTAIIAEGLLETLQHVLEEARPDDGAREKDRARRRAVERLRRALRPAGECPTCQQQEHEEQYALSVLIAMLGEPAERERFAVSDGLCLPHLRAALAIERGVEQAAWFIADQRARIARVRDELERYIGKHDARFAGEPGEAEREVVRRATGLLVGSWFELLRGAAGRPPSVPAATGSESLEASE
jgi:hypothetical protein